jgi:RNA polymerase sigma-70 factor (ECF subfamily)
MSLRVILGNAASTARDLSEEASWIAAAKEGNSQAFQQLYELYRDRVYNLIYYSLHESHQAEDILQSVFLKVFQALPLFREDSSFLTWIYRVTLNECKNAKRRRKFWLPLSEIFEKPEEKDRHPLPDVVHSSNLQLHALRNALLKLKSKYREVVMLKYFEELSYEEVSSILGISMGTVASRLHRAMQILESQLRERRV